ncbi:MAG: UDP-glucose/GDP-mannose dehydrogenase family protein [Planctomycetota bacterium]|jgi:UDPglucose 6-dehydrogenase
MKIAVIGTGYVGLVTGTCLAESGNEVVGIDKDIGKVKILDEGRLPIYEPGLLELVQRNRREQRLTFTTDLAAGIQGAKLIFIAVGTPQSDSGAADLSALWAVGDALAANVKNDAIIVIKSTVPVGTNRKLTDRIKAKGASIEVASNPEFLKEGAALDDFMKPDRVVVGVRSAAAGELLKELYSPFLRTERPFLLMSPESAEMTKYVANAMLATKISFINEMANLCEKLDADINDVRRGIGHDQRIGFQFLHPGPGYGGSCFPKDVNAIIHLAKTLDVKLELMDAVDRVNIAQKLVLPNKVKAHFGKELKGKTLAVWGIAFKPGTDDIREAPALSLIDQMLAEGVHIRIHDPEAIANTKELYGDKLTYCDRPYGALEGADALALVTEWPAFRRPDFEVMKKLMRTPVIFDGRNLYEPKTMEGLGFTYFGIGR